MGSLRSRAHRNQDQQRRKAQRGADDRYIRDIQVSSNNPPAPRVPTTYTHLLCDRFALAFASLAHTQREDRRKRVEAEKAKLYEEWDEEWNMTNTKKRTFNPNRTKYKKRFEDDDESTVECWRCGREGHMYRQCYFTDHIDGIHVYKKGETLEQVRTKRAQRRC